MTKSPNSFPQAVIHFDLDGASAIYATHGRSFPYERDPLFETGLSNALEFLDSLDVKATMFVIARDLQDARKRELIEEVVNRGHEIASHSLTHRNLPALDQESKRLEVFRSRKLLETELGVEVQGFRAPSFDINRETLELLAEAGYLYDSSLLPNAKFVRKLGITEISELPHRPLENYQLMELPLPSYSPLPFPFHPSYSLILGIWYFRLSLRRFRQTGAPLILLFHLTDLAPRLPYSRYPGWKAKVCSIPVLNGERKLRLCKQMVELVHRHYSIVQSESLLSAAAPG